MVIGNRSQINDDISAMVIDNRLQINDDVNGNSDRDWSINYDDRSNDETAIDRTTNFPCQREVANLAKNLDETSRALKEMETRLEITQRRERRARERLQELHDDKRKLRDRVKAAILQMEILECDKRRAEELAAMAKEALSNAEAETVTPASIAMSKNYERVGFVEPLPRGGGGFVERQGTMEVEADNEDQVESGRACRFSRCEGGDVNMRGAKEVVLLGWITTGLLSLLMIEFVLHDGVSLSLVATFISVYVVVVGFAFGSAEAVGGLAVAAVCLNSFALGLLLCRHSLGNALLGGVVRTFKGLDYMMQAIFSEPAVPQPAIGRTTQ
ncbi:hypothetical protein CBR_g41697 [Chara braunii]|uniref:Uncharacterized protein n=1 Tax=Chara braunii TaxID=69332 RepID=A0A388LWD4_CHABU|nr:hypothetical protein CBR_g41697 [Chara braunii]|eukprot:GBG86634.1 hypothetical protein CBR_g41697 [Chara braunii]